VDARQLELFLAVLDAPTMTQAAERVHLSTPAVSVQLRALADELNVELFVRSGRRLLPTAAARHLETHARRVVGDLHLIKEQFDNAPAKDGRPFRLATGATALIYRLGVPLRRLRRHFPRLDLHVTVLSTEQIVAGVGDRQFDLGLISLPVSHPDLRIIPLFDEELLVLRPSAWRRHGSRIGTVRPDALEEVPFLLNPKWSNMRAIIDRFFHDLGIEPRVTMEAADTEVIKCLVECGFGHSILPEHALKHSSGYFQTLRVAGHPLARKQALVMAQTARGRALTDDVALFLKHELDTPIAGRAASARHSASHHAG
jgi:DNA-binding transcriptional LysR family regulator